MSNKKKKIRLKTNAKVLLICIMLFIIIISFVLISELTSKVKSNPPGTIGNTGGNINNEGLFCQDGNLVYFSNPLDENYIYSMNLDGSDQKRVLAASAKYINSAGNYLYYNQIDTDSDLVYGFTGNVHGIYRYKKGTNHTTKCLDRTVAGQTILVENDIYYQHYDTTNGVTLYRSSTNGDDKVLVLNEIVNPACVINGNIYYPDQNNYFNLNLYDKELNKSGMFLKERMYQPVYEGGYIYYIGVGNNYELRRYSFSSGNIETLTKDRVDRFNVLGDTIFYQRNSTDTPALICMKTDGSDSRLIAMGNYTNINMTSYYTYYYDVNSDSIMYRVLTSGDGSPQKFVPDVEDAE